MMVESAFQIRRVTGRKYDGKERRFRVLSDLSSSILTCLAHIINLVTLQAVIKTCSKLKCYDPHAPEEHVPDLTESHRDFLGIVRAIAVKEHSSTKREELFRSLQQKAGSKTVLQLILDMIIRWSSTYAMLHRGYTLREFVDAFVLKIAREEKDPVKSEKLHSLLLFEICGCGPASFLLGRRAKYALGHTGAGVSSPQRGNLGQ
ncbi:hypothetical protein B0H13DRAFT_1887938 [Mycena leptocephala]|nr:hypothetical protein B0H13DRAFT_1887938 [Mycena leptocephala]